MFRLRSWMFLAITTSTMAEAHSLRSRIASANASDGTSRQRLKSDLNISLSHQSSVLSQSSYVVSASRERYVKDDISEDEYLQDNYGSGERQTDAVSVAANQTWSKLTDTRAMAGFSSDTVTKSRTAGLGLSRWAMRENLQLSLDVSRTVVEQPVFEVLGADSDVVSPPGLINSTGVSVAAKILASPTTVTSLSYTHIEKNDRPPTHVYAGGVKRYVPFTKSAVHFDLARIFNQGRVTTKSTYGEVDAWIAELAYLQTLWWRGAQAKASYRYYREDEVSRVEGDEYTRGSDLVGMNLSQELTKKMLDSLSAPLTVEASAARYRTNELDDGKAIVANIYELGLLAKF
jgi:hypothetical protein